MRQLENWLDAYMLYTSKTESAKQFHRWVGISAIASVLQRKVWLKFGMFKVFPNMYIVLTADPGVARKTQAIRIGQEFLSEIPDVKLSPDSCSARQLFCDLEEAIKVEEMPDGKLYPHCSLTVSSDEFESFLGDKKTNTEMITILTNMYDCKSGPYKHKTKHSGKNNIENPYLNLIAGTTPSSLAESFPIKAIGGGLGTRIIFVWAYDRDHAEAYPEEGGDPELKQKLIHDLSIMARDYGEKRYSPEARKWWDDWYNSYDIRSPNKLCDNPKFMGWYSRKSTHVQKLAICLHAAESNEPVINTQSFTKALACIEDIEREMSNAFIGVGRTETSNEIRMVEDIIKSHKSIREDKLFHLIWADIDSYKFETYILPTILKRSKIEKQIKPKGNRHEIWYQWKE